MKKQFYTNYGNIQIIICLLKKYGIKHIVVSAGNRHSPLVHSLENERLNHKDFFKTYSVVDERSASFVALGLIQKLHEPVAICCISGTASCNYVSAVQEAFYQQLPLVVITADRNPMYLYQQEEQMAVQQNLFAGACKKEVTLPIVRDEKDAWYCSRLVNEALMDVVQGVAGPVHINYPVENDYPVEGGFMDFDTEILPDVRKTERLLLSDSDEKWQKWAEELREKKILVIYGQYRPLTNDEIVSIEMFCKKFNCVISTDLLSNLNCSKAVDSTLLAKVISGDEIASNSPDVIMTMNGNSIAVLKLRIPVAEKNIRHIHISEAGLISDPFKVLSDSVACSPILFFQKISNYVYEIASDSYFNYWNNLLKKIRTQVDIFKIKIDWSAVYTTQQIMKDIPENSLLHLANSNSVRLCSLFPVKKGVEVYCNRGTNGIDGSMSSFVGNCMYHDGLCFLFIGDLSFFYDMNALWNRFVNPKMRILVNNNAGGAIFYTYPSLKNIPTLADNIAAEHSASVRAWAEDRGFLYFACRTEKELEEAKLIFFDTDSEKPVLIECFTEKNGDADAISQFIASFSDATTNLKKSIASHLSPELKAKIKKIIR